MRWCGNCRRLNSGWPTRCRYCAVGFGRLCPRNHANPSDPQLAFCGESGEPLERRWSSGRSLLPYAVGCSVFLVTILLSTGVVQFAREDIIMSVVLAFGVLILGLRLGFHILPPWVRNVTRDIALVILRLV